MREILLFWTPVIHFGVDLSALCSTLMGRESSDRTLKDESSEGDAHRPAGLYRGKGGTGGNEV